MTRYYVDISTELLSAGPQWPEGFRLIGRLYDYWTEHTRVSTQRWLVEDDHVPEQQQPRIEGALMMLDFVGDTENGTCRISNRSLRKTHPLND